MIENVKEYCTELLEKEPCKRLPFHNLIHTEEVVENIRLIAFQSGITLVEQEPLIIAGWFHDTGHSICYKGHEAESVKIAQDFLRKAKYPSEKIEVVLSCIKATEMPQNPQTELDKIICDADIMHLSTEHFFYRKLLLRREWELVLNKRYTDKEWHELNLAFLENQGFHTKYGKQILSEGVERNKAKVLNLLRTY